VPFASGPNLLVFNARVLRRPPTSWRTTWFPSPRLAGHVTRYTSPIYLADAALYLRAHRPALGIRDPFELTDAQLQAAAGLVQRQPRNPGKSGARLSGGIAASAAASVFAGPARPIGLDLPRPVRVRAR